MNAPSLDEELAVLRSLQQQKLAVQKSVLNALEERQTALAHLWKVVEASNAISSSSALPDAPSDGHGPTADPESPPPAAAVAAVAAPRSDVSLAVLQDFHSIDRQQQDILGQWQAEIRRQERRQLRSQRRVRKLQQLISELRHPYTGIEVKDRRWRLRKYVSCFLGSQLVDWLIASGWANSRAKACKIGRHLAREGVFYHVAHGPLFEDGFGFYRFRSPQEMRLFASQRQQLRQAEARQNHYGGRGGGGEHNESSGRGPTPGASGTARPAAPGYVPDPRPMSFSVGARNLSMVLSDRLARQIEISFQSGSQQEQMHYLQGLRQNVFYLSKNDRNDGWTLQHQQQPQPPGAFPPELGPSPAGFAPQWRTYLMSKKHRLPGRQDAHDIPLKKTVCIREGIGPQQLLRQLLDPRGRQALQPWLEADGVRTLRRLSSTTRVLHLPFMPPMVTVRPRYATVFQDTFRTTETDGRVPESAWQWPSDEVAASAAAPGSAHGSPQTAPDAGGGLSAQPAPSTGTFASRSRRSTPHQSVAEGLAEAAHNPLGGGEGPAPFTHVLYEISVRTGAAAAEANPLLRRGSASTLSQPSINAAPGSAAATAAVHPQTPMRVEVMLFAHILRPLPPRPRPTHPSQGVGASMGTTARRANHVVPQSSDTDGDNTDRGDLESETGGGSAGGGSAGGGSAGDGGQRWLERTEHTLITQVDFKGPDWLLDHWAGRILDDEDEDEDEDEAPGVPGEAGEGQQDQAEESEGHREPSRPSVEHAVAQQPEEHAHYHEGVSFEAAGDAGPADEPPPSPLASAPELLPGYESLGLLCESGPFTRIHVVRRKSDQRCFAAKELRFFHPELSLTSAEPPVPQPRLQRHAEDEDEDESRLDLRRYPKYLEHCRSELAILLQLAEAAGHKIGFVPNSGSTHPFIAGLHDCVATPSGTWMMLDWASKGDLFSYIHSVGCAPEATLGSLWTAQLVSALRFIHQLGIVHRDVKPENIIIQESGHVMLCDFGLANRLLPLEEATPALLYQPSSAHDGDGRGDANSGADADARGLLPLPAFRRPDIRSERSLSLSGTAEYLAPEMLLGASRGDAGGVCLAHPDAAGAGDACGCPGTLPGHSYPVDFWQLGLVVHEMLAGSHPFYHPDTLRMHQRVLWQDPQLDLGRRVNLSIEALSLIGSLLHKQPHLRLGSRPDLHDVERHPFFARYGIDWSQFAQVAN